jgi:hypothetical protein
MNKIGEIAAKSHTAAEYAHLALDHIVTTYLKSEISRE